MLNAVTSSSQHSSLFLFLYQHKCGYLVLRKEKRHFMYIQTSIELVQMLELFKLTTTSPYFLRYK